MPRETVVIDISATPSYEAVARFFSVLAYPDPDGNRERFYTALCRHQISLLGKIGHEFVPIRPSIMNMTDEVAARQMTAGLKRLRHRHRVGKYIVAPMLNTIVTGPRWPNVNELIESMVNEGLGWANTEGDSGATAKTDIWKPSWPVAHATAAFWMASERYVALYNMPEIMAARQAAGITAGNAWWTDENKWSIEAILTLQFLSPRVVEIEVGLSELFQRLVVRIPKFRGIRESDMVAFALPESRREIWTRNWDDIKTWTSYDFTAGEKAAIQPDKPSPST